MVDPKIYVWCEFCRKKITTVLVVKTLGLKVCKKLYILLFLKLKTCEGHIYGAWAEYQIIDDFNAYRV